MDLSRIQAIIANEFDMEILLRYRELQLLLNEEERSGAMLECLQKIMLNAIDLSSNSSDLRLNLGRFGRSTSASRASQPTRQYEVRPDGKAVLLRCPKCGAERFRSNLGFQNHCRLHCKLVFVNTEDRIQRCGVVVDPSEVPRDFFKRHPSQLERAIELAQISSESMVRPLGDAPSDSNTEMFNGEDSDLVDRAALRLLGGPNAVDDSE